MPPPYASEARPCEYGHHRLSSPRLSIATRRQIQKRFYEERPPIQEEKDYGFACGAPALGMRQRMYGCGFESVPVTAGRFRQAQAQMTENSRQRMEFAHYSAAHVAYRALRGSRSSATDLSDGFVWARKQSVRFEAWSRWRSQRPCTAEVRR